MPVQLEVFSRRRRDEAEQDESRLVSSYFPLPFRRSVLPFRCTVAVLPFRSYRVVVHEN